MFLFKVTVKSKLIDVYMNEFKRGLSYAVVCSIVDAENE